MDYFESSRLIIRRFHANDWKDLYEYLSHAILDTEFNSTKKANL